MNTKENRTQQAIMSSLLKLLENKNDIQQIKIIDILKKDEIAKGTFYKYFRTKEDLIQKTLAFYMDNANKILDETFLLDSSERTREKFVIFVNLHKREYRCLPLLYGKAITNLSILLEPLRESLKRNNYPQTLIGIHPIFLSLIEDNEDLTKKTLTNKIQETIRQKSEEILLLKKANGQ